MNTVRLATSPETGDPAPGLAFTVPSAYWAEMTEDTDQKLGIDWLKTMAGALAAVSSAVLLSTLGAAGTIIGAAMGSVIATVGGALYSQGLARSRKQLTLAQATALRKFGSAQAEVRRAGRHQGDGAVDPHLAHADEQLEEAKEDLDAMLGERADRGWRDRFAMLPWKQVALVAAGLFVGSILAITGFELVAGETVSSMTGGTQGDGGTTITHIGGGSHHPTPSSPTDGPSTPAATPSTPEASPSGSSSSAPSPSGSPTASPSESTTPSPSESTTPSPSDSETATPPATTPTP